jgi:acyl-CoA synthetase (NDP forming)
MEFIFVTKTESMMSLLRDHWFALDGDERCVPEPVVKQLVRDAGMSVPAGAVVGLDETPSQAAAALKGPFVLKGWGPGIVHKSELGAVRVKLAAEELDHAARAMAAEMAGHGIMGARFYVEEMAPAGTEVLFGVVARPPFGNLALLGVGGTLAELFGNPAVSLCPLTRAAAADMVDSFPGAALLCGYRGAEPANRDALIDAMLAVAGEGGLIDRLGDSFAEFECNPLFVGASGTVAADARLILRDIAAPPADNGPADLTALFHPRSVAVVGASATRATAWGNRTLARYRSMGWTDNLYAIHPTATEIDGVPAYPSLGQIPGGVDYAEISVGAETAADVLRAAAGNARTATVNSAGFAEVGEEGRKLEAGIVAAARQGGIRFIGPNCMGVFSPRGRQGFSGATSPHAGRVAAIMQSGGLSTDLIQAGANRGLKFSAVVSAGNAADIRLSDLLAHVAQDPDTKIIGVYVEGGADARMIRIIRDLRGKKPVVLLVPGLSEIGSKIAASHTGSMTSDRRGWEALVAESGATMTGSFEEFLACLTYLDCYHGRTVPVDGNVLAMGLGGGASVLCADACDAAGLLLPTLMPELQEQLADKKGGILLNPLDLRMGPAGPPEAARTVLDTVLPRQPFSDVLVHINLMGYMTSTVPGRLPGLEHFARLVAALEQDPVPNARIAIVTRNAGDLAGPLRDEFLDLARRFSIPMFDRFSEAASAISAAKRFYRMREPVGG